MRLKLVVVVAAGSIALGLVIYKSSQRADPVPSSEQSNSVSMKHTVAPRLPAPRLSVSSPPVDSSPDVLSDTNLIARLLKGEELPKLSPEQVKSYAEENHHSVESLLAAFHANPR